MGNCCKNNGNIEDESKAGLNKAPEFVVGAPSEHSPNLPFGAAHPIGRRLREVQTLDWSENPPGAFADEKALEWLNFIVRELWPYVDEAIKAMVKDEIEPQLKESLPSAMSGAHFTECRIGTNVPVLSPVRVFRKSKQRHPGIEIDIGFNWDCEADIALHVMKGIDIGIKRVTISGKICLVLRPMMKTLPIVGGMQIFMLSPPVIDWDFTGAGHFVDFPLIKRSLRKVVRGLINDQLVLPNRLFINWLAEREHEVDLTAMQFPMPEGLLRFGVLEARGLEGKDWNFFGKNTSDPYACVHVGARSHHTATKNKTCDPVWGDAGWSDFFIFSPYQPVHIEVWDDDIMPGGDDLLGNIKDTTVKDIASKSKEWYDVIGGTKHSGFHPAGEVRVSVETFEFKRDAALINAPPKSKGKADAQALLHVQLRGLRGLSEEQATGAVLLLHVGEQTFTSAGATFVDLSKDLAYDQAAQRMAEYLKTQTDLSTGQIAKIAGLDEDSLEKILRERPSFTTRWNQGFNILVSDMCAADIRFEVRLASSKDTFAQLQKPYSMKDLLASKAWDGDEKIDMSRDGVMELGVVSKPATSGKESETSELELDLSLSLFGFKLTSPPPCAADLGSVRPVL